MSDIKIKLKESSQRDFLTTSSGYTITKDKYVSVNDEDRDIHSYIINRNDIDIKDTKSQTIVDSPESSSSEKFIEAVEEPVEEITINVPAEEDITEEMIKNDTVEPVVEESVEKPVKQDNDTQEGKF